MIFIVLPMQRMCLEKLSPPDSVVLPFAGENSFFINRDGSVGMNTTTVVKYSEETHFTTTKNVSSVAEVIVKTTKTVEKVEFIKKSNITIQASNNLFSLLALIKKSSSKVKSLTSFGQISVNMGFTCHVVFPSSYSRLLNSLNFVNLDLVQKLSFISKIKTIIFRFPGIISRPQLQV